tara:strand:+ start:1497 stop:3056 length:1560 start_codon:yes stop_codon:yes gene_type:complete
MADTSADEATRQLMHGICELRRGTLYVSQSHLAAAVKTRKLQAEIGANNRADRIRGWLAREIDEGRALLLDPAQLEWMGPEERTLARLRLDALRAQTPESARKIQETLEREEAKGAVLTWAAENEEPPKEGEPIVLRKEKRAQLRTARHRIWKNLGAGSLNAVILLLLIQGAVYPESDPETGWIQTAATWIETRHWSPDPAHLLASQAETKLRAAREKSRPRDGLRDWDTILDLGEGWGSIGTAAQEVQCATIGVDIAGVVYQGSLHGHIRARVHMDFAAQSDTNLLRRVAKKAGISLSSVMAVWLSPECTLLSMANHMNKSRGCAHGPYAETLENRTAATPERLELERSKYQACIQSISQQMEALVEENPLFMLENPQASHFWELTQVKQAIAKMSTKGWKLYTVDQCAYGRKAQKPTVILTNIPWDPQGLTGTGRCVTGSCGGTMGNVPGTPGAGKHSQQTVTSDPNRRTRMGEPAKGQKGEYSVVAAKNRVEASLVQELIQAARAQREARKRKRGN